MVLFCRIWSVLFHPLVQGFALLAFLFYSKWSVHFYFLTPINFKWKFLLFSFFFLILSPTLSFLIGMKLFHYPTAKSLFSIKNRSFLYPVFALFFFIFWLTIRDISVWIEIKNLVFSGFVCLVLLTASLPGMNVSAHTAGTGIILGFLILSWIKGLPNFDALLLGYLPLAGITGSARLWLSSHSLAEITWGYLTGLLSCFFSYFFLE
ncbi:MAG: hypothetical protein N3F09_02955 [Bacteroidia bacterium]|nr:hypothetical protein [Bacteroidia bacterium]